MTTGETARKRPPLFRFQAALAAFAGLVLFAGFLALGIWQLERREWKLDLIAAVNAREAIWCVRQKSGGCVQLPGS